MCGIAGILSTQLDPSLTKAAAERMQNALVHRGPDDSGLWQSPEGCAKLAHRRLSILDLSRGARQPMSTPDGRFTLCFNGEIYNFRELRAQLEETGIHFNTTSDTEVLLRLYEREGMDCTRRLRGMFAFAIWDAAERICMLARDPLGIKPLYLHRTPTTLAFASELRALVQCRLFTPTLSAPGVQRFFETGSLPEPLTLINEAECLPAGESLLWHEGSGARQTFWRMEFASGQALHASPVAAAREALQDSVRHHFVSDVPVGIFLSGGIDSTAVLALANATGHQGVSAFSVAVDDAGADESPIARRTAAHFGADYQEMRLDAKVAQVLFSQFLTHLDQPSIDGLNTFTVSALARQHGVKVVLSGLGGDELFGGYASFTKIPRMLRWHQVIRRLPGARALLTHTLSGTPQHRRLAEFLRGPGTVEDAFASLRGIFSRAEAAKLTEWITGCTPANTTNREQKIADSVPDEISRLELSRYMRNQLLRDSDVMSMAHGVELRVPLVDRVLFEALAAIPACVRLQPGKRLFTQAVPEVPGWVVSQKKRGFLFPYQKWLSGEWGNAFEDCVQGSPVPMVTWYQKWSLFVLRQCLANLGLTT